MVISSEGRETPHDSRETRDGGGKKEPSVVTLRTRGQSATGEEQFLQSRLARAASFPDTCGASLR